MMMMTFEEPLRFCIRSFLELPELGTVQGSLEDRRVCTVWARFYEKTGLLWIESIECDGYSGVQVQFSPDNINRFYDLLTEELCSRF